MSTPEPDDFETAAARDVPPPLFVELWRFVKGNKKWWMLPILAAIVLLAAIIALGGSAVAPFIYTLF